MQSKDFKIEVNEKRNYIMRSKNRWVLIIFFNILMILYCRDRYHLSWITSTILVILVFIFVSYFLDNITGDKYFITKFEIKDNIIYIAYKEKMKQCEIKGNKKDFVIEKARTLAEIAYLKYLKVTYNGITIIKQYKRGDWDEDKFDEIIKRLNG